MRVTPIRPTANVRRDPPRPWRGLAANHPSKLDPVDKDEAAEALRLLSRVLASA